MRIHREMIQLLHQFLPVPAGMEKDELIATVAGNQRLFPESILHIRHQPAKRIVPCPVAVHIIDHLEIIDIQRQDHGRFPFMVFQVPLHCLVASLAVVYTGEGIGASHDEKPAVLLPEETDASGNKDSKNGGQSHSPAGNTVIRGAQRNLPLISEDRELCKRTSVLCMTCFLHHMRRIIPGILMNERIIQILLHQGRHIFFLKDSLFIGNHQEIAPEIGISPQKYRMNHHEAGTAVPDIHRIRHHRSPLFPSRLCGSGKLPFQKFPSRKSHVRRSRQILPGSRNSLHIPDRRIRIHEKAQFFRIKSKSPRIHLDPALHGPHEPFKPAQRILQP